MHDPDFFPAASEPDVEVEGHLVPASFARMVTIGWRVAALYTLLLSFGFVLDLHQRWRQDVAIVGTSDLLLLVMLVFGVRRWSFPSAVALCLHPVFAIGAYGARWTGLPLLGGGFGALQVGGTLIVVAFVGRAAVSIRTFRRATRSTRTP